ncbi:MAG: hypothetical protein ACK6D5_22875, partial [Planctomyces sp.]
SSTAQKSTIQVAANPWLSSQDGIPPVPRNNRPQLSVQAPQKYRRRLSPAQQDTSRRTSPFCTPNRKLRQNLLVLPGPYHAVSV